MPTIKAFTTAEAAEAVAILRERVSAAGVELADAEPGYDIELTVVADTLEGKLAGLRAVAAAIRGDKRFTEKPRQAIYYARDGWED